MLRPEAQVLNKKQSGLHCPGPRSESVSHISIFSMEWQVKIRNNVPTGIKYNFILQFLTYIVAEKVIKMFLFELSKK